MTKCNPNALSVVILRYTSAKLTYKTEWLNLALPVVNIKPKITPRKALMSVIRRLRTAVILIKIQLFIVVYGVCHLKSATLVNNYQPVLNVVVLFHMFDQVNHIVSRIHQRIISFQIKSSVII